MTQIPPELGEGIPEELKSNVTVHDEIRTGT